MNDEYEYEVDMTQSTTEMDKTMLSDLTEIERYASMDY